MSFTQQAWPLLYSHPWHQYLAFTPPSSLCSSICFLAQVAMCPQVILVFTYLFYILEKHSIHHLKKQNRDDVFAIWTIATINYYIISCMHLKHDAKCLLLVR